MEYNYFLHADFCSKQVTFALNFLKYNKKLPNNTKFFHSVPSLQGVLIGYRCLKEARDCSPFEIFQGWL